MPRISVMTTLHLLPLACTKIAQNITMILTELVDVSSFQSLFCKWTQIKARIFSKNKTSRYAFKQQQTDLPHQCQAAVKIWVYCKLTRCRMVGKGKKVIQQQAEVPQGVPGRLRPRIFLTFGTTRVVGHQPYAPATFTPGEIPGTHFQRLSRPQGTWFCRGSHGKNNPQWYQWELTPGPSD